MIWILAAITGYLLGSIPSAVWIGKLWHNIDIRQHGSGNAGATNVFRVLGKKSGIVVLSMDILKGAAAALFPSLLVRIFDADMNPEQLAYLGILGGVSAVLGHLYPVFAQFKGGKGVATMLGIMLALQWWPTWVSVLGFVLVWISFSYISLASISGGLLFPLAYFLLTKERSLPMDIVACILPLLLLYTHRANMRKLLAGTENKMYPFKRKKEK